MGVLGLVYLMGWVGGISGTVLPDGVGGWEFCNGGGGTGLPDGDVGCV